MADWITSRSDAVEQVRHLREDSFLYQAGESRYICAILGAIHEELEHDRPDLVPLLLECVWMARRMNDAGQHQRDIWKDGE